MTDLVKSLTLSVLLVVAALATAPAALAQDSTAPAASADTGTGTATGTGTGDAPTADGLSLGSEVGATGPAIGQTYTRSTVETWEVRCVKTANDQDPCQLYQLLKDSTGNAVAEISIFPLLNAGAAVAGATIVAPLETLLTQQLVLAIDGGTPKAYPFTWCSQIGCIARVGFTAEEIEQFKKGAKASITIVPVVAPDQTVVVDVSLKGFTAGFKEVSDIMAALPAPAPAAAPEAAPANN